MTELTTLFTGRHLIKLDSVDSTNRFLSKLFSEDSLPEGTGVLAEYQTAGQGMAGNYWISEKGKNLLLSLLFMPHFLPIRNVFLLNKAIALGVYNFIKKIIPEKSGTKSSFSYRLPLTIKWPNDIYILDEKVCGIKIDNAIRGHQIQNSIVGIGININQVEFPPALLNPISLKFISGKELSVAACFSILCNEIEKQYLRLKAGHDKEINQEYHSSLYRLNKFSWFMDVSGSFEGMITDVDEEGRLCILGPGGKLLKYQMKDIKYLI
jgi:BirA family transcriptional regulator, biotin operon repressor / biotin---[acetyl-CoA-carboxylase] ligase